VKSLVKVNNYEVPEGLYYHKEYGWTRIENGKARIGITDYAQKQLREIVFVELPSVGDTLKQNDPFGTVESVKAVSDLVAPISGKIEQINEELSDKPELLNEDPYNKGWILVISSTNLDAELKQLMDFNKAVEWHKELVKEG
jgi:glycine cleavage system H protein